MKVPFINIVPDDAMRKEIISKIDEVIRSGQFILGKEVERFEEILSNRLSCRDVVGVGSGTDALSIALDVIDPQRRATVITTPFTFISTAEVVIRSGRNIRFVDVDPDTYNINVWEAIRAAEDYRNPILLVVHLFGLYCDVSEVVARGIRVISDSAQAYGIEGENGERIEETSLLSCYSFFPTKNIGCYGDGGAIATNIHAFADKARLLRNHGHVGGYKHDYLGYNSRLDAIQAAILRIKLKNFNNHHRYSIAFQYHEGLEGLEKDGLLARPVFHRGHNGHQYTIRVSCKARDGLKTFLEENGIETKVYYPIPLHRQPCLSRYVDRPTHCPVVAFLCKEVLSLPTAITAKQCCYVIDSIKNYCM